MAQIDGLKAGLEAHGIETYAGYGYLSGSAMTHFVDSFKPDVVIEINRSRNQIPNCSLDFNHVSWVWDAMFHNISVAEGFGGSLYNFFAFELQALGHDPEKLGRWSYLFSGVDENVYSPTDQESVTDCSMIGTIAPPISDEELSMDIVLGGKKICTIHDIFETLQATELNGNNRCHNKTRTLIGSVLHAADQALGEKNVPPSLLNFCEERFFRTRQFAKLIHTLLSISKNIRLYGYEGWRHWPDFAPYYQGPVYIPSSRADVYRQSYAYLDAPQASYENIFETMACGRVCLVNRWHSDLASQVSHPLEAGKDYLEYDEDSLAEVFREVLQNPALAREIAQTARSKVLAGHTWKHRAAQVLETLNNL